MTAWSGAGPMRWEYEIVQQDKALKDLQGSLNRFGQQGWELVQIVDGYLILRRPVVLP